jgi:hypothetical protein
VNACDGQSLFFVEGSTEASALSKARAKIEPVMLPQMEDHVFLLA